MSYPPDPFLPLQRGHNFRDLGGYETGDGRRVRHRLLYRSGTMADLTEADVKRLTGLGIVCICDLRTTSERTRHPTSWHDPAKVRMIAQDYDHSEGSLATLTTGDAQAVRQRMISLYRTLHEEQRAGFAELFARLVQGELPLLFNCAAGKDRTGIAAALVLSALGVPRNTVIGEYVLSDRYAEPLFDLLCRNPRYGLDANSPRESWLPMTRAYPEYIETMLDAVTERHGSIESYLAEELGIDGAAVERLRDNLLE
ncbi:MAG: tyrosine-protein phosphatase [Bradyrhizobium sp.]|uniref:tyrosine-protein phosphatase n=1 Tax=Bradyrhizobium sp. TaxID=376 RepID=UPI001D3BA9A2|nr:tyrosine-protein phosphatase [Bradyrhizobium sp.]MBV9565376.1 tyrosine-protein phosphatase [Bradyrhizobium sp.]